MEPNKELDIHQLYNNYGRRHKFVSQRIHNGFCDGDWWDMDNYLLELLPAMLNRMAEKTIGYPATEEFPTPESWRNWLKETANHFILAKQEMDEFWEDDNISPKTLEQHTQQAQLHVNEGFARISKYFFHLWD